MKTFATMRRPLTRLALINTALFALLPPAVAQTTSGTPTAATDNAVRHISLGAATHDGAQVIRLTAGERKFISFAHDILSVDFPDTKVVTAWAINARTLVVEGHETGDRILVVFTSRYPNDTVGEACRFDVNIPLTDSAMLTTPAAPSTQFTLRLLLQADTVPEKYFWTVDALPATLFTSLASPAVRGWVHTLPAGATFTWATGADTGPLTAEANADFAAFKTFCATQNMTVTTRFDPTSGLTFTPRLAAAPGPVEIQENANNSRALLNEIVKQNTVEKPAPTEDKTKTGDATH